MAVRFFNPILSTCRKRLSCGPTFLSHVYTYEKFHTSLKYSSNDAFWDIEGSIVVDKTRTAGVQLKHKQEPVKMTPSEDTEVVRLTNFGHIRLDQENLLREENENLSPSKDFSDSMNFIDNQFFGEKLTSSLKSTSPAQTAPQIKASEVPVDTNPIDQQYFYPNSKTQEESKTQVLTTPSASELKFEDNEIDDQYFGEKSKQPEPSIKSSPAKISAYSYLRQLQAKNATSMNTTNSSQSSENSSGIVLPKTYSDMIPNLYKLPNEMIVSILKKSVLYNQNGIVAISKPYGLVTTDADGKAAIVLTNFLPALSEVLRYKKLYTVHRLDRDTTGILILASNQEVANQLNKLFLNHEMKKTYLAITKGIPSPNAGTIDIPICEKNLGERKRMALRPVLKHDQDSAKSSKYNSRGKSFKAITHFVVKRSSGSAAFVELKPETGVRHQLRVHLSEALSCPVLGDHKYSHDDKYAPQKLPQDMLDRLAIKQSKVRNVPMHLHAATISIPGFGEDGKELVIVSPLPEFFRYTLKKLKIDKPNKR